METLYILTRTSGRPEYFKRCAESVDRLKWPGKKIWIVHTDDPRDTYVRGDLIVQGETLGPSFGSGFYNLYQNRLLDAIPGDGWVHFLDDDDEYLIPDALDFVIGEDQSLIHICKTRRKGMSGGTVIFPAQWKNQISYQTECFVLWSAIAKKYKWWGDKGGDHQYTRKITRNIKPKWHDVLATQAQVTKGHGKRLDAHGEIHRPNTDANETYYFKMFATKGPRKQAQLIQVPGSEAVVLEKHGLGRITYNGVTVCTGQPTK